MKRITVRFIAQMVALFLIFAVMPSVSWGDNLVNLALKKQARQSSTGYGGDPGRAVDGNTDGNHFANSVTHTNADSGAWWEVDLGRVQNISEINIWNRTDCCSERLSNFYVLVSERPFSSSSLDEVLNDSSVWSSSHTGNADRKVNVPANVSGRYVRVQLRGSNYLSLAEVQVMGIASSGGYGSSQSNFGAGSGNLALKKQARQSSTGYGGDPKRAVDGNTDGSYFANSVTHTNADPGAWWEVDLGRVQNISEINIWNRTDCCSERLSNFYVLVSERPFSSSSLDEVLNDSSVWSSSHTGNADRKVNIPVNVSGRYVRVQLRGTNYLSLAEVQVMGTHSRGGHSSSGSSYGSGSGNLAVKKQARQSSTGYGGDPGRAVDGNTDGSYFTNSVTHTNADPGAWWEVDLGRVQNISEINIWNRTDCCSERLSNFYVLVSERPFTSNSLDDVLNNSSVWSASHTGNADRKVNIPVNVSGRYVRVQLRGTNYLSLAEVQVMGQ